MPGELRAPLLPARLELHQASEHVKQLCPFGNLSSRLVLERVGDAAQKVGNRHHEIQRRRENRDVEGEGARHLRQSATAEVFGSSHETPTTERRRKMRRGAAHSIRRPGRRAGEETLP
jgi:hypothetical protein